MVKNFEDLEVWTEARILRTQVSKLCRSFPSDEKFKLTDQLLRSSRSVTANIAEGYGRFHFQENIQFCRQARGSLMETLDHILCASDEEYIVDEEVQELRKQYSLVLRLLNGYIAYLKKRKSETVENRN